MDENDVSAKYKVPSISTAPQKLPVNLRGFDTEEQAYEFSIWISEYIREIGRKIDISQLDGLTIAYDYRDALLNLDRGYVSSNPLTPSDGHAIGIAMTPSVIRDSTLKSHIVLNAAHILPLKNSKDENFGLALHILFHECAHVEITDKFNKAFPGTLLKKAYPNLREAFRWQIILACWDEYAATWISAPFGDIRTDGYEETFLKSLNEAKMVATDLIKAYRIHGSVDQILAEVYGVYGDLLKFTAYHLGNMKGLGLTLLDLPRTKLALEGHWFSPYFEKINLACENILEEYGEWSDQSSFEVIGDIADQIVAEGGLYLTFTDTGQLYVEIPCTPETMPDTSESIPRS